ncbi:hypothetical protein COU61_00910 [Candidatus Pacearchaeota archaeon CG10_big_fil_rev_8_21_14_0_10_35_13]|nr:MAG: hypothetical protein COU61_00910 [Candidatus Pacearchaeota archaeon CG10_big_fil_rev_8_21_14_0_10_35_13]
MLIKSGDKKGQFYLIATMIIITLVVSLATVRNYTGAAIQEVGTEEIRDLGKELNIESARVIDYGVYNNTDLTKLAEDWTEKYINYSKTRIGQAEWVLIYGNSTEITIENYTLEDSGEVSLGIGEDKTGTKEKTIKKTKEKKGNPGETIKIRDTEGRTTEFNLSQGQKFYYVITKEERGGRVVETNK